MRMSLRMSGSLSNFSCAGKFARGLRNGWEGRPRGGPPAGYWWAWRRRAAPHSGRVAMEFHPICNDYAPFTSSEAAALEADIRANGLVVPVVLWRGKVVDGRHRFEVCTRLGIAVRTIDI